MLTGKDLDPTMGWRGQISSEQQALRFTIGVLEPMERMAKQLDDRPRELAGRIEDYVIYEMAGGRSARVTEFMALTTVGIDVKEIVYNKEKFTWRAAYADQVEVLVSTIYEGDPEAPVVDLEVEIKHKTGLKWTVKEDDDGV
jgi:hypothetical protein